MQTGIDIKKIPLQMKHPTELHHSIERDRIVMYPTVVSGTRKTYGHSLVLLFAPFFPRPRHHNCRAHLILLTDLKDVLDYQIERLVEAEQSWSMKIPLTVDRSTNITKIPVR